MLSTMHLGSVLVGIVAGLALGVLAGWLAGSRRRLRSPGEPGFRQTSHAEDPGWNLPPRSPDSIPTAPPESASIAEVEAGTARVGQAEAPTWSPHPALSALVDAEPASAEPESAQSLLETLQAVNRRLTDDAQARLSRQSGDIPAEAPEPKGADGGSNSPGQDLLALSRRLTEDSARRLSRDPEPSG
jgi:hypothetical protein